MKATNSPNRFWICMALLLVGTSVVQGLQAKDAEKGYSSDSRVGPCAEGRPKAADLEVSGVFVLSGVSVAQAEAGTRNFLLRAGDRLCDGTVVSVEPHVVTLKSRLGETIEHAVGGAESRPSDDCVVSAIEETGGARLSCQSELRSLDAPAEEGK